MKTINCSLLFILALSISTTVNAAGSMLRVTCEGDDVGAEVLINGKFKGECPMDVQVPAGTSKVLVKKKIGDEDRIFEQDIRMGDGGVKKIEAKLISKNIFLHQQKAEAGDIRSLGMLRLIYMQNMNEGKGDAKQNAEHLYKWTRKLAEAGEADAMIALGEAYQDGIGVEINMAEANRWYSRGIEAVRKAADGGDAFAMLTLGISYAKGKGVPIDREKAAMWFHRAKDKGHKLAEKYLEVFGLR